MTIAEMHTMFKLLYDKTDSLNYPNFLPEEIDIFLNMAQDRIIEQRAYGNNIRKLSFEESQKRIDDLRLVTRRASTSSFFTLSTNKPNGKFVILPGDYLHCVQEDVTISYSDCNNQTVTQVVGVTPMTHDRYNKIILDPFNKPSKDFVIRLAVDRQSSNEVFELITDSSSTITNYKITYIRKPLSMRYGTQYATPSGDVDCELAIHTHREIVEEATKLALENIQAPRIQTFPIIQNQTE